MGRRKEPADSRGNKIRRIASLLQNGLSYETIRKQVGVGKDLIGAVSTVIKEQKFTSEELVRMTDEELDDLFRRDSSQHESKESIYEELQYSYLEKELMKPGVTKQLLWEEYKDDCVLRKRIPYQLTQFKKKLNDHIEKQPYASLITHKPGVLAEVDWTGDKASWSDPDTGEVIYGWLFVGVLSFSGLAFAKVYPDMEEAVWIKAHTEMFCYFNGVPLTLRCDNLKTGVVKHPRNGEYVIQKDYKGLASYYGIAVVPAEPRAPKSKPLAENSVKNCEQRLLAALRNETFYSIDDYNKSLAEKLEQFNNKRFQKKNGSRRTVYEEYEKETLLPLPHRPYEYREATTATVLSDGFISFDKNFYSVPDKRPGEKVTVYAYSDRIEIYDGMKELTCFPRSVRGSWKKNYNPAHFKNTAKGEWNKERFMKWAGNIGPKTYEVVSGIFKNGPEQVYYSSVHSLLKLSDRYTGERVENACALALRKLSRPTYRTIKAILENEQDLKEITAAGKTEERPKRKEFSYLNGDC